MVPQCDIAGLRQSDRWQAPAPTGTRMRALNAGKKPDFDKPTFPSVQSSVPIRSRDFRITVSLSFDQIRP